MYTTPNKSVNHTENFIMNYGKYLTNTLLLLFSVVLLNIRGNADTLTTSGSVQIVGKIEKEVGDFIIVRIGEKTVKVRKDEIVSIEKNDLDGSFDLQAAIKAAEEEDKKLTAELGLNQEQREQVYKLILLLTDPDHTKSSDARKTLVKMSSELNLLPYIEFMLPSYLPPVVFMLLEFITEIDPVKAQPILKSYVFFADENVRAQAIEMLGIIKDSTSLEFMMRALLDHTGVVKISACKALAMIGAREATPLLLQFFDQADLKVQNNVRNALTTLWSEGENQVSFESQEEWLEFWKSKSESVSKTVNLEGLEPLVPPHTRFAGC